MAKEKAFAVRLGDAVQAVETEQAKVTAAQEGLRAANEALAALLKELPADHPLRGLAASKAPTNGKPKGTRERATAADLEALRGEVLAKLLNAGKAGLAMGDLVGDREGSAATRLANLVRGLPESGEVVKTGEKKSTRYYHKSHAPKATK